MAELTYEIIRSGRKTLSLEITRDGRAIVRAPYKASARDIEAFVFSHEKWFNKHMEKAKKRAAINPEPDEEEKKALIALSREYLPRRVAYFSEIMGVAPTGITITGAKGRYGSCSPKNRLCFSFYVMRYPASAVDYVVVHELAHIKHKNHSKDFYAFVGRFMPDYKERAKLLKNP